MQGPIKMFFFVGDLLCVDPDKMSHLTAFYKSHILYGSPMCAKVPVMGFQVYRYMKSAFEIVNDLYTGKYNQRSQRICTKG